MCIFQPLPEHMHAHTNTLSVQSFNVLSRDEFVFSSFLSCADKWPVEAQDDPEMTDIVQYEYLARKTL